MKDQDNSLYPERQPGPLAELFGARVEQWYALNEPVPVSGQWCTAQDVIWAEQLGITAPDVKVLMRYGKSNGWLDGQPAAVTRTLGSGSITYIGCALDEQSMMSAAKWMVAESGATTLFPNLPKGVEVSVRSGAERQCGSSQIFRS